MFEDKVLERGERVLEGVESPRSVPASHDPSFESDRQEVTVRAPSPHESPVAKAPASPVQAEPAQQQATGKERRAGFLRRRPIVSAIGAMLLASALGGGYLHRRAAILARPQSVGLPNRRPRHRQRACQSRRRDRPHR